MSKIKNGGLDQYAAEPFEQHQFGTAGVEGVKPVWPSWPFLCTTILTNLRMWDFMSILYSHHRRYYLAVQIIS